MARFKSVVQTFQVEIGNLAIRAASFPDVISGTKLDEQWLGTVETLSGGGDARITLDQKSGLNRYLSAPYPRQTLAYASSTANDVSTGAFARALALTGEGLGQYSERLESLRGRIRAAYGLDQTNDGDSCEIVFAPSGTDLEYVALAAVREKSGGGIHNILLGADEVGSGCIHSAHGRYFAQETACGAQVTPDSAVAGMGPISLADIPVRCSEGQPRSSAEIADAVEAELALAKAEGKHGLVHVVHGSKTGLILPELCEIDRLQTRYAGQASFVVDACQARITGQAIRDYLARGAVVFLTGSKFMGGPPFSGFALVPSAMARQAAAIPSGFVDIFRRAEWPECWAGRDCLEIGDNAGLWLRLECSIFELERFQNLPMPLVERIIALFQSALASEITQKLGLPLVQPFVGIAGDEAREHPIEMQTLATLDVSSLEIARDFDAAQVLHRKLALSGLRLGQPVRAVRADGQWAGTLRIGLSMPQFAALAQMDEAGIEEQLRADMARIAEALQSAIAAAKA